MLLDRESAELERLGFAVVSRSEHEVVGVLRRRYWDCLASMLTTVVFLRATGPLTAGNIRAETERMIAMARELDPSHPTGLSKSPAVIAAYSADTLEPDAAQLCSSLQPLRLDATYFPAALDRASGRTHYSTSGSLWGGAYYVKLRYFVRRLLDPAGAPDREPVSWSGVAMYPVLLVLLLASGALLFAVAREFSLLLH